VNNKITYHWSTQKYKTLVEGTTNPMLKEYQYEEVKFIIKSVQNPQNKIFIDVGAGYGRVSSLISKAAKRVIAVEIDKSMIKELKKRAKSFKNITIIEGDANNFSKLTKDIKINNPVFLILQNSFGTWIGNYRKALSQIKQLAKEKHGEVILSLFAQEGLQDLGVPMYFRIKELVGEPDLDKTDFEQGNFYSKTGYFSHWWRPEERQEMINFLDGKLINELKSSAYHIFHIIYS